MIDLHTHILTGLDDGAPNNDISLGMAEMAARDGTTQLVATPHMMKGNFDISKKTILDAVDKFNELLRQNSIDLIVRPGAEYYLEPDLLEQFAVDDVLTINNSSPYILVELPSSFVPDYTAKILYELQLLGLTPIIAHPERNAGFARNPKLLKSFCERGCLSQITSSSITGLFGRKIKKVALDFIASGLVHMIASDAHSNNGRAPILSGAAIEVERRWGRKLVCTLFLDNPERIICGVSVKPPEILTGRRLSWLIK
ncbi:MAG: CpsB/CapC family capsule biosynthesis tyrosine phosphatase [Syntrophomonas sp.]